MKKPGPDVKRAPASHCLNCGARMDALGTGHRAVEAQPHPGDIAVCIRCGGVMKLDDRLRLRGMSEAEMDELVTDHVLMDHLASLVRRIYFLKHSTN